MIPRSFPASFSAVLSAMLFTAAVQGIFPDSPSTALITPPGGCGPITFETAPEYPAGDRPFGVRAVDMDNDGRPDILATSTVNNLGALTIRRNLTGSSYSQLQVVTLPGQLPDQIYPFDADADGRMDLAITYRSDRRVTVLRNGSTGPGNITFSQVMDLQPSSVETREAAIGDVDGDGIPDLVVASRNTPPAVSVFRNLSPGTGGLSFAPRADFPIGAPAWVVALSDLDGDGKLDIASGGNETSRDIRVLRNTSSGPGNLSFAPVVSFAIANSGFQLVAGDLDGDGKPDLALPVFLLGNVTVLRNTSSGPGNISFAARSEFLTAGSPTGIVAHDHDGDGRLDLATVSNSNNGISILLNDSASGSLAFRPRLWDTGTGRSPQRIAVSDINGDGQADLLAANYDGNSVSVHLRRPGAGIRFYGRHDYLAPNAAEVRSVALADIDSDGKLDLVSVSPRTSFSSWLAVHRGDGTGHYPERYDFQLPVDARFIQKMEIDGDGRPDLVFAGSSTTLGVRNLSGPGDISFELVGVPSPTSSPGRIAVGDFDGDAKDDFIVAERIVLGSGPSGFVYRNTSSGGMVTFSGPVGILQLTNDAPIFVRDVDADGKQDLIYASSGISAPQLTVQRNTGSPGTISFTPVPFTDPAGGIQSVLPTDLDSDGLPDLVATASSIFNTLVFRNLSTPAGISFGPRQSFSPLVAYPVASADLDGDGLQDVVMHTTNTAVQILRNSSSGPGTFALMAEPEIAGGANTTGVGVYADIKPVDMNGDGRLDLVANHSGFRTGSIPVYLGKTCATQARPAPFDFDGDGRSDVSVYRPQTGQWWLDRSVSGLVVYTFGNSTDVLAPADFTGDGRSDVAVFRQNTGEWFVLRSEDLTFFSFPFGAAGDIPVPADYDGDAKADAAVFRPSDSTWYIQRSAGGNTIRSFGISGDRPVPADYDGDGKADLAIYRPASGQWWLDRSSAGIIVYTFGNSADRALPSDFTGDGRADVAIWRPSTGEWFILRSEDASFYSFPFGSSGDIPSPGDYDGDGRSDATVFRPSSSTWYSQRTSAGILISQFGSLEDRPVPGSFVR